MVTMNLATKLHILLAMTIVSVGLYMFFLYKELKVFQQDIVMMKQQIQCLMGKTNGVTCDPSLGECKLPVSLPTTTSCSVVTPTPTSTSIPTTAPAPVEANVKIDTPIVVINDNVDDDEISVTSNEIKDILTNIQSADEDQQSVNNETNNDSQINNGVEEVIEETHITFDDDIIMKEKKPWPDYANMTDDEIAKVKYDDLRNFLRSNGVNMKGTKQELISKIKEIVIISK